MVSIKNIALSHIKNLLLVYILVTVFFITGVSAGAFTVDALDTMQKEELVSYFRGFFKVLDNQPVHSGELLRQSLANNMQFIILIWILGITVVGTLFIPILVGVKGFIIGFSVGFLVEEMGFKGLLFALAAILPQNLLIVPGIIGAGSLGIGFSLAVINRRKARYRKRFSSELAVYTLNIIMTAVFVFAGACIEGYITPVFVKMFKF